MCTTLQEVSITAHISTDTFPMHPILQQVLRVVCADNPQHRNGKYTGIVRVGRGGEAPNAIQPTANHWDCIAHTRMSEL